MADQAISAARVTSSEPGQTEEQVVELSFDLYERYSVLRPIVRHLFPLSEGLQILDVGGNSPDLWPRFSSLLKTFLPEARCTVADLEIRSELQAGVRASGLHLPFADNTFDVVCALDTLDHFPDEQRRPFISELLRVTRDIVYLTFPYKSASTVWAEKVISAYLDDILHSPVRQLQGHCEFGLPDHSLFDDFRRARNLAVATFYHGNIDVWLFMMLATRSLGIQSPEMVRQLNVRFNRDYAQFDWREPTYRASYLFSKLNRQAGLNEAIASLKPAGYEDLRLSEALDLIRAFAQFSLDVQTILDKDRNIRNLSAKEDTLTRALEDKGSQIVNLEAELKAARRQAAVTAELQLRTQKLEEGHRRLLERHASLEADAQGLAHRLHEFKARVQREVTSLRNTLQQQQDVIRQQQNTIRQQQAFQAGIASRLASQELFTAQLVTGRTWRTLHALGKVVNQILPAKRQKSQVITEKADVQAASAVAVDSPNTSETNLPPADEPAHVQEVLTTEVSSGKELYFVCDEPSRDDKRPRNRTLVVRGWALGEEPLDYVEVAIAGLAPQKAGIGTPRPDVKHRFPDVENSGRSGFSASINTQSLPDGRHSVHLRLIGNDKIIREIETEFLLDHSVGYASDYEEWTAEFEAPSDEILLFKLPRIEYRPLISVIMPVFNTERDQLSAAIHSVLAQSYSHWELCIADDGSTSREMRTILAEVAARCENIKIVHLEEQGGIATALNTAVRLASGEYLAFLDHDDTLSPHALGYVIEAIERHHTPDFIYSDEDKLDERGARYQPFFKPDWSPDLILSTNYICHLLVIRKDVMDKVGDFCPETDGSQDYDYILRASEHARQIVHIPRVLYHWRAGLSSTASSAASKPYTIEASRRAIERYCERKGNAARVEPGTFPGSWRMRYPIPEGSRVSIIIAAGGNVEILKTNLESLFTRTEYLNFEVVVMDNSRGDHIQGLVHELARAGHNVRYVDWREQSFNYSKINNVGARQCDAPILLFLNDDVSVINNDWLTSMVELIARPEVGAVGAKLLFPNGRIQHAGVIMGLYDNCGHAFSGSDGAVLHYFGFTGMIRNVSAVTGACLMTKTDVFWKAGGFDEDRLAVAFNDVDLCLKIGTSGYRVLFTPFAQLYHHESFSKTQKDIIPHPTEVAIMQSKWREVIAADPYYSPNLTRLEADYSLPTLWM